MTKNKVVFFEIPASNFKKAKEFYENVFDWKVELWGDEGAMAYTTLWEGEEMNVPGMRRLACRFWDTRTRVERLHAFGLNLVVLMAEAFLSNRGTVLPSCNDQYRGDRYAKNHPMPMVR